jgi:cytochrome c553
MAVFRTGGRFSMIWLGALFASVLMNVAQASDVATTQTMEGDAEAGKTKSTVCAACHGADGNSTVAIWPKLAGQSENYLRHQITAFRDGDRVDPSMQPMVANLSDQDVADLAAYFSSQTVASESADPQLVQLGALIYRGGNSDTAVPACSSCHLPDGSGNNPAAWPALKGQHADYVVKQLQAYASGSRVTDPASMMQEISQRLTEQEMKAVAQFVTGLQ